MAFVGGVAALRYARQVLFPCPTAVASRWQRWSAPARPPRLAVVLVSLLTKKFIIGLAAASLLPLDASLLPVPPSLLLVEPSLPATELPPEPPPPPFVPPPLV